MPPLAQHFATPPTPSPHTSHPPTFTPDDDNDLGLAHLVARAYLPGIAADSVHAAVVASPSRFYVARAKGVWGAEECLRLLVSEQMAAGGGQAAAQ